MVTPQDARRPHTSCTNCTPCCTWGCCWYDSRGHSGPGELTHPLLLLLLLLLVVLLLMLVLLVLLLPVPLPLVLVVLLVLLPPVGASCWRPACA